jgi:hypothetical protein
VDGTAIAPRLEVKILGVILDQMLWFKSHVGKAASKGMKAVLALRWLCGVPPPVARQLFISTVASKIDYAASVWCLAQKDAMVALWIGRPFEAIQRIATQAIVGVFRTAALPIAEAEAGIEPTCVRLRSWVVKHWITCHTLLKDHPFWTCRMAAAA